MTIPPQQASSSTSDTKAPTYWAWSLVGLPIFWGVQLLLRQTLDLRDYPGAAGTLSLLRATGNDPGEDSASYALRWIQHWLNIDLDLANTMLSVGAGSVLILGSIGIAWAAFDRQTALWTGILAALWTPHQFISLMTGIDPLALGTTAFALAATTIGLFLGWWGLPIAIFGAGALISAIQIKSIAIPLLAICGAWTIFPKNWKPWLVGIIGSCTMLVWLQPATDSRFPIPVINRRTIGFGWMRIQQLIDRGFPEGKFDQLWITGGVLLLGWLLIYRKPTMNWCRVSLLWLTTGLVMCVTAASLGQVLRPRYLVGLGMGLIIPVSWGIGMMPWRFRQGVGIVIALLFTFDTWAFFSSWGRLRQSMLGGSPPTLPEAPTYWKKQYTRYPVLTLKDLTMTGALDFQDAWMNQPETLGIALPRLRDERHRNIQAYAAMRGQDILILDPGKCCAGHPVNAQCAKRIAKATLNAGYALLLPTAIHDVERIYANEQAWIEDLTKQASDTATQTDFWVWQPTTAKESTGTLPCQFNVPFKTPTP